MLRKTRSTIVYRQAHSSLENELAVAIVFEILGIPSFILQNGGAVTDRYIVSYSLICVGYLFIRLFVLCTFGSCRFRFCGKAISPDLRGQSIYIYMYTSASPCIYMHYSEAA